MKEKHHKKSYRLDIEQIQKLLPHRFPFLLVDRIEDIFPTCSVDNDKFGAEHVGTKAIGYKNVSIGEPVFQGHFPGFSIWPGAFMLEAMAQVSCFTLYPYLESGLETVKDRFQCILLGVDEIRFRRPVVPGDVVKFEITIAKCRGKIFHFACKAWVEDNLVAEGLILANMAIKGEVK